MFFRTIHYQRRRKCFLSERELKKALRDTMTRAAWLGLRNFWLVRSEHAHASYPGLFFRSPGFSPYMGREERRVQGLDYITVDMFSTNELCQHHVYGAEKNTHSYSSLLVSTMKPQELHRALESLHLSWWTRNKNEKCLKHVTSSILVKCISMIVSVVMPSYPAITFFLWYVTSEH